MRFFVCSFVFASSWFVVGFVCLEQTDAAEHLFVSGKCYLLCNMHIL